MLVLTPTRWVQAYTSMTSVFVDVPLPRELAFQIADQFAVLGAPLNVRTAVIVGGMDMMAQAIELEQRPHVVVATPGRMVDHLRSTSGDWSLSRVQFLVCPFNAFRRQLLYSFPNRSSTRLIGSSHQHFRQTLQIYSVLYRTSARRLCLLPR